MQRQLFFDTHTHTHTRTHTHTHTHTLYGLATLAASIQAAGGLPLVVYNVPAMTGIQFSLADLQDLLRLPGVIGSGIPSLTRLDHWKILGPWKTRTGTNLIDSSLGAEDDMIQRFQRSGQKWQQAALLKLMVPAIAMLTHNRYNWHATYEP